MFVFTWFLIPETKGISLERMDELFGAVPQSGKEMDFERSSAERGRSIGSDKGGDITVSQVEKS